jgi:hypothetical protein
MHLKILHHYNITTDLLSNDLIRGARYDVGELNQFLVNEKPLVHLSLFDTNLDALYFTFTKKLHISKKPHPNELIYFTAPNADLLKKAGENKSIRAKFYHVVTNRIDQHFLDTADHYSITKFNFANAFKKSHLKDWNILLGSAEGLRPNCTLLNTFLSLGASLSILEDKKASAPANSRLELISTIDLSFQHSIEIYESKKR